MQGSGKSAGQHRVFGPYPPLNPANSLQNQKGIALTPIMPSYDSACANQSYYQHSYSAQHNTVSHDSKATMSRFQFSPQLAPTVYASNMGQPDPPNTHDAPVHPPEARTAARATHTHEFTTAQIPPPGTPAASPQTVGGRKTQKTTQPAEPLSKASTAAPKSTEHLSAGDGHPHEKQKVLDVSTMVRHKDNLEEVVKCVLQFVDSKITPAYEDLEQKLISDTDNRVAVVRLKTAYKETVEKAAALKGMVTHVVLAGEQGAGKTTLCNKLVASPSKLEALGLDPIRNYGLWPLLANGGTVAVSKLPITVDFVQTPQPTGEKTIRVEVAYSPTWTGPRIEPFPLRVSPDNPEKINELCVELMKNSDVEEVIIYLPYASIKGRFRVSDLTGNCKSDGAKESPGYVRIMSQADCIVNPGNRGTKLRSLTTVMQSFNAQVRRKDTNFIMVSVFKADADKMPQQWEEAYATLRTECIEAAYDRTVPVPVEDCTSMIDRYFFFEALNKNSLTWARKAFKISLYGVDGVERNTEVLLGAIGARVHQAALSSAVASALRFCIFYRIMANIAAAKNPPVWFQNNNSTLLDQPRESFIKELSKDAKDLCRDLGKPSRAIQLVEGYRSDRVDVVHLALRVRNEVRDGRKRLEVTARGAVESFVDDIFKQCMGVDKTVLKFLAKANHMPVLVHRLSTIPSPAIVIAWHDIFAAAALSNDLQQAVARALEQVCSELQKIVNEWGTEVAEGLCNLVITGARDENQQSVTGELKKICTGYVAEIDTLFKLISSGMATEGVQTSPVLTMDSELPPPNARGMEECLEALEKSKGPQPPSTCKASDVSIDIDRLQDGWATADWDKEGPHFPTVRFDIIPRAAKNGKRIKVEDGTGIFGGLGDTAEGNIERGDGKNGSDDEIILIRAKISEGFFKWLESYWGEMCGRMLHKSLPPIVVIGGWKVGDDVRKLLPEGLVGNEGHRLVMVVMEEGKVLAFQQALACLSSTTRPHQLAVASVPSPMDVALAHVAPAFLLAEAGVQSCFFRGAGRNVCREHTVWLPKPSECHEARALHTMFTATQRLQQAAEDRVHTLLKTGCVESDEVKTVLRRQLRVADEEEERRLVMVDDKREELGRLGKGDKMPFKELQPLLDWCAEQSTLSFSKQLLAAQANLSRLALVIPTQYKNGSNRMLDKILKLHPKPFEAQLRKGGRADLGFPLFKTHMFVSLPWKDYLQNEEMTVGRTEEGWGVEGCVAALMREVTRKWEEEGRGRLVFQHAAYSNSMSMNKAKAKRSKQRTEPATPSASAVLTLEYVGEAPSVKAPEYTAIAPNIEKVHPQKRSRANRRTADMADHIPRTAKRPRTSAD